MRTSILGRPRRLSRDRRASPIYTLNCEEPRILRRPPEVVWAVLSDVESWPAWTASITSVRPSSPDPLQVGSRVRIKWPRLPATVWTVSDLVEEERFTWTSTGPGVNTPRVSPRRRDRRLERVSHR
ncbi:SRPBCC family protein [Geodermatophilus obscurus]|uniref:SRPBCC family protein n=1 Tax=Geodermatophilus obscurus TaxID=1861 RepID=UPI0009FA13CA